MRKLVRIAILVLLGVVLLAGVGAFLLFQAAKHEPAFYQQALRVAPKAKEKADELERNVLELHNDVRRDGRWEAIFDEEQVNSWLAVDLPTKFPEAIPKAFSDPRISIRADQVMIACRYSDRRIKTVLSLAVDLHLTEEPNVIAVRIRKARAGMLPLPLNQLLKEIETAARQSDLGLRWAQTDGDPVALVEIPFDEDGTRVRVKTIELRDGSIRVAGVSGDDVTIHSFTSLVESLVERNMRQH